MSKVSRAPKLPKATPPDEDDSSLEDDDKEVKPIPKEPKEKARAVEPKPKVVLDAEGGVKIKDALIQNF